MGVKLLKFYTPRLAVFITFFLLGFVFSAKNAVLSAVDLFSRRVEEKVVEVEKEVLVEGYKVFEKPFTLYTRDVYIVGFVLLCEVIGILIFKSVL